jgi:hypothetical protein
MGTAGRQGLSPTELPNCHRRTRRASHPTAPSSQQPAAATGGHGSLASMRGAEDLMTQ